MFSKKLFSMRRHAFQYYLTNSATWLLGWRDILERDYHLIRLYVDLSAPSCFDRERCGDADSPRCMIAGNKIPGKCRS